MPRTRSRAVMDRSVPATTRRRSIFLPVNFLTACALVTAEHRVPLAVRMRCDTIDHGRPSATGTQRPEARWHFGRPDNGHADLPICDEKLLSVKEQRQRVVTVNVPSGSTRYRVKVGASLIEPFKLPEPGAEAR